MTKLIERVSARPVIVALAIGLLLLASVAEACPGCKDALAENDPNHARIVQGYFWSILFMMSMPFALLGSFGTYIYLEVRRARSDQQQLEESGRNSLNDGLP